MLYLQRSLLVWTFQMLITKVLDIREHSFDIYSPNLHTTRAHAHSSMYFCCTPRTFYVRFYQLDARACLQTCGHDQPWGRIVCLTQHFGQKSMFDATSRGKTPRSMSEKFLGKWKQTNNVCCKPWEAKRWEALLCRWRPPHVLTWFFTCWGIYVLPSPSYLFNDLCEHNCLKVKATELHYWRQETWEAESFF
jgi:hypothetical protein